MMRIQPKLNNETIVDATISAAQAIHRVLVRLEYQASESRRCGSDANVSGLV